MQRIARLSCLVVLGVIMASSLASAGNIGFCAPTANATACSGQPDTNPLGNSKFGMWSFGSGDTNTPWYLFLLVPETSAGTAVQPGLSSSSFTLVSSADAGTFTPSTSGDIYNFAATAGAIPSAFNIGNNSFNKSNLFGSLEQAAYGGTPNDFEVFVYEWSGVISGSTAYSFKVTSGGLVAGTAIGAVAIGGKNDNKQFSTPWTTAGLVSAPEPGSLMFLSSGLLSLGLLRRRRK